MPAVALGVAELRIRESTGSYRAFYFTKQAGAVLIFHAFTKKDQKTPKREIEVGRQRLEEMLR
jgi:phage-related protein